VSRTHIRSAGQGRLLFNVARTTGNGTSDFTLGSQGSPSSAFTSASPVSDLWAGSSTQRAASTTSSGNVEAIKSWARSSSGYSAIEASSASSCSALNGWAGAGWTTLTGFVAASASSGKVALKISPLARRRTSRLATLSSQTSARRFRLAV
jgi:hypothetical protein